MHQSRHPVSTEESPVAVLYQRHAHLLLAYIRPRVSSKEDAEDLLVEVFLIAMRSEVPLRLSESEQLTWLRHVAHNKIIDRYRHIGRLPAFSSLDEVAETLFADDELTPESQALRNGDYAQLRNYLASLPQFHQEVLWLRFAKGLSTKEIARRLAKSDNAIRMLLSRTLNRLRSLYELHQEGEQTHE